MKKIIIFLVFFASSQSFAQNANPNNQPSPNNARVASGTFQQGVNNKNIAPKNLTPEQKALIEKNIANQKEFEIALKNLKPSELKKFNDFNQNFNTKMIEYHKTLNDEVAKISKIQHIISITSYIFKGKIDASPTRSQSRSRQDFFQKNISDYQKLPEDKKLLIKKEIMKFRKNVNELEKKRRQNLKILFKKDFDHFKERETAEDIKNDDK